MPNVKPIPTQYDNAETVKDLADDLIKKYHTDLVHASIAYLYKNKEIKQKGKNVIANIKKCNTQVKFLTGFDYILSVAYPTWQDLTDKQKIAVIDHELCHCLVTEDEETGDLVFKIVDHDFADFNAVLERHGLYMSDLQHLKNITVSDK